METGAEKQGGTVDALSYLRVILKNKKLIAYIVGIAVVVTILRSLAITPVYEAKATIIPANAPTKDSGMSSMAAAQFGIALPAAPQSTEMVTLLRSNSLKEKVIRSHNLLPVLLGKGSLNKSENSAMWAGIRNLQGMTKVKYVPKEVIIDISVENKNPKLAADILQYTLDELNGYMSNETKRVAEANRRFLESQLDKVADPYIKARIYTIIAQQIETSMMAEAKENFAFKVLDAPRVPDRKIRPKRAQMVLVSFVVALFLGIFAAFGKEFILLHRAELAELGRLIGLKPGRLSGLKLGRLRGLKLGRLGGLKWRAKKR